MGCIDGEVVEGMILDLNAGPRLHYWTVLQAGLVQYSSAVCPRGEGR
jgi:hypothetical protein